MGWAKIKVNDPEIGDPRESQWASHNVISDRRLIAAGSPASKELRLLAPLVCFVQVSPSHVISEGIQLREGVPIPIEIPKNELGHLRVEQSFLHASSEDGRDCSSFLCICLGPAVAIHHEGGDELTMSSQAKTKMQRSPGIAHFEDSIRDRRVLEERVPVFADCSDEPCPLSVGVTGASD